MRVLVSDVESVIYTVAPDHLFANELIKPVARYGCSTEVIGLLAMRSDLCMYCRGSHVLTKSDLSQTARKPKRSKKALRTHTRQDNTYTTLRTAPVRNLHTRQTHTLDLLER